MQISGQLQLSRMLMSDLTILKGCRKALCEWKEPRVPPSPLAKLPPQGLCSCVKCSHLQKRKDARDRNANFADTKERCQRQESKLRGRKAALDVEAAQDRVYRNPPPHLPSWPFALLDSGRAFHGTSAFYEGHLGPGRGGGLGFLQKITHCVRSRG